MLPDLHTDFFKQQVRCSGIPISWRIFQFVVIHIVKGFGIVNKAEIDVFLELSCFFNNPTDVGNLISDSSAFFKTSLNNWKFTVHALWSLWSTIDYYSTLPYTCYRVHGILPARTLEWLTLPVSRGSSQPRDWIQVSHISGRFLPAEPQYTIYTILIVLCLILCLLTTVYSDTVCICN